MGDYEPRPQGSVLISRFGDSHGFRTYSRPIRGGRIVLRGILEAKQFERKMPDWRP